MEQHADAAPNRIVGVGASAGGLESLEHLFAAMPADTGMAFVVIQHLSPDFRSLMDELIARKSEMPVLLAKDGTSVQANTIYLLPPKKEMIIRERCLILTDKEPGQGLSLPIDQFFRSLALDQGPQAVAVVLSGSGTDGSRGIVDVKRAGGTVFAESIASAKFDGMPQAAAATGVVDQICTPTDIARALRGLPLLEVLEEEALSADPGLDAVLRLLRDKLGIDFSQYKVTTVSRRIQRRMDLQRIENLPAYVEQLRADPDELSALYQDLLIGVTQFFRDLEAFEALERDIIPQILDRVPAGQELRMWTAGCATGEEAYSIAMLFYEQLTARKRPVSMKLLATDVHPASLEVASAGLYGEERLANVSAERLERFFTRRSSGLQISSELRQLVVFARHNVLKDAPFTKLDFISCRNMLIYLQPPAQRTVLSLFHFGLRAGGTMFLGASESPGPLADEFTTLDEHCKMYRKRRDVQLLSHVRLPLAPRTPVRPPSVELPRVHGSDPLILATYDQLLDEFMPPSLLVDEDRCLIDSFGGAEQVLKVRRRRPSMSVLELLDGELRTVVASAVARAFKEQTRVAYTGVRLPADENGDERRCTLAVRPFVHPRTSARHVLVSFGESRAEVTAHPEALPPAADAASSDRVNTLETQLAYAQETLQATIEELETSNEEMQATNEELVASNEELQSTNEELHSVNEELYSVNAEYQQKIAELKEANTDIGHLLEGTDVGTVFLDRDLRIRRYTPRLAQIFHLVAQDLGRKITDFSHDLVRPTLYADIDRTLRSGQALEVEVRDRLDVPYFMRLLPYRAGEGPVDGVVMTLTDLSALDRARAKLAQLSAIVESCEEAIVGASLDGKITAWNRGAERLYGYTADEAVGRHLNLVTPPDASDDTALTMAALARGEAVERVQAQRVAKDGTRLDVVLTISPIRDRAGQPVGGSVISHDVTPMVAARRELELAARRREQFLAMLSHELRNPLAAVLNATNVMKEARFEVEAVERCHAVLGRQVNHMARLLDDLLDVSRVTSGKFELRKRDLDLRGPTEAAIESTAPLFRSREIALEVEIPTEPVMVRGDASRLQQVVVNLLSNAATYSPRGSTVWMALARDDEHGAIVVSDNGVGIEPEMIGKIFELFVQAAQRIDRARGGLGVGLSLAKTVIDLHGGTIEAYSDGEGKGSRFTVRLPIQPNVVTADPPAAPRVPRPCRIVLVEDQLDAREMMRALLERRRHIVIEAADGAGAVEAIEREHPDCALVDIGLPIINGYTVARQVRSRPHLDDIFLIALTGYGSPTDVTAAREAGFDEHLVKPIEMRKIEELLAKRFGA